MSDQPNDPHDEALRAALRAEADGVTAGPDLLDRIHAATDAAPSGWIRRTPWLLVAAAAVAVIALAATLVADDGDDDQRLDLVDDPSPAEELPDQPLVACAPDEEIDMAVYLEPDSSAAEVSAVGEALEATGFATRYVGPDETYEEFQRLFADNKELLATVTPDVLPTSYLLDLDRPSDEAVVRAAVEGSSSVYDIVAVECEPESADMFDLLSAAFPCDDGFQTVFYLSPTTTASESEAVKEALETHDRVRSVRFISADEILALAEGRWEQNSLPTAYLATADTEEDDLAVRGAVSDLAGIIGTSSTSCTDPSLEPTGERPTVAVAVTDDGRLVVIDVATGNKIRELAALDDPNDPEAVGREGGAYVITGVALHPNGRDVYYDTCCEPASGHVERVSIDGSTAPLAITGAYGIDISADGRWLVGIAGGAGILLYDLEGGTGALLGNDNEAAVEWEQTGINADGTEIAVARSRRDEAGDVVERTIERYAIVDGALDPRGSSSADTGTVPLYTPEATRPGVALLAEGKDLNVDASGQWLLEVDARGRLVQRQEGAEPIVISEGPFVAADW
jgi:hypothetical protein